MTKNSPFKLDTKRSLAEQVADRITELVVGGDLVAGDRLPPEVDLAIEMGVSRTALREGMRTLEAQGLLKILPGVGTVVREVGSDQLVQPLSLYVEVSDSEISFEEFHAVRVILETEVAALAAGAAVDSDVLILKGFMADMEMNVADADAFAASDASFHESLAKMASNPLFGLLIGALRVLLEDHIREVVGQIDPVTDVIPYHAAILEAVEDHDADSARRAMENHLAKVKKNYYSTVARGQRKAHR
ncbi:MAG: FadR family transcriptional regulator [Actinobacteria bacterium]|nr:FadR family transcriptional regulator [Actinomycetota bacterium]